MPPVTSTTHATASTGSDPIQASQAPTRQWWKDAVVYQIYPRSFADADGNGIGDLAGITSRVPYLARLGVDAVWLSPFYPSALADGGYDVDDYRDVAPEIGTLEDFDAMVAALHEAGIRVIVDLVPNHTSNRHAWFRAALAGGPDAPERGLYHFYEGRGEDGVEPPNDWRSLFGGSIWERVEDQAEDGTPLTGPGTGRPYQWYLHIFAPEQPDLNWANPAVRKDFERTLRFWCDRGVDGFRVDVAHGMTKDMGQLERPFAQMPYWPLPDDGSHALFDRDEVHEVYAQWRTVLDSYDPPRFAVAEAGVHPARRARYAASIGQAFNFQLQDADFTAPSYAWAIDAGLADEAACGSTTWVLGCHDTFRVATRYGFDPEEKVVEQVRADRDQAHDAGAGADGTPAGRQMRLSRLWLLADGESPAQDAALGERRARAGAMLTMALPGCMYVYQGDELGVPEVPDIPEDRLQDPIALRNREVEKGRDGCRVPLPWSAEGTSYGFGPDGGAEAHLPQPAGWGSHAVDAEEGDSGSTLALYRRGLELRHQLWGAANREPLSWLRRDEHVLAFARGEVECWTAFDQDAELPAGEVLLASGPLTQEGAAGRGGVLPAATTVWLRRA
ncbi:glycoside hydrolase family 13 protein [Actinomyces urogenitalis]|uniref:glycoside hydrolase family 13 protein n=1 Tax=Actinomyces urogenitalis TaxID=103621 RepID=UPI001E3BD029|nr:glycoside hydrolase family 13 protein [Actinomyces urogenitalis]MDK8238407.1 glycoside hydrolase family 13 protein [Actinomyces urogenitalis]WOO95674.1 glycoside hydrolase family 13 protein [Actinomyces urogenitalis]